MVSFEQVLADYVAWLPLFIFLARVTDVSMGTVRTIFIVRGMRFRAALIGFVEVTIWILAVSTVVRHLDRPLNVVAYAGGFATGNWVGMWVESKLALGQQIVRMISRERGAEIATALRQAGLGVTEVLGQGRDGPVSICFVAAPRKEVEHVVRTATLIDPRVFITVEDARWSDARLYRQLAQPKTGWRSVLKKK